jgi:SAM-dependent methyltransferase
MPIATATLDVAPSTYRFVDRSACPVCMARTSQPLYVCGFAEEPLRTYLNSYYGAQRAQELDGHGYTLVKCTACQLVYQRFIGDSVFLKRLYDQWLNAPTAATEADRAASAQLACAGLTRDAHELMWVSHCLRKPLPELNTLDYGMGFGLWARISRSLGCQSFGFDLSDTRMCAASKAGVKVRREEDFPAHTFDFINTEQVFEHVPAPRELAKRLAACLKPGGILKICVPYGEDIERCIENGKWQADSGSRHSLDPVAPLEHINCFKAETLRRLAAELGLVFERPQILPQFAYLAHSGTWSLADPSNLLKELSRPLQRRFSRRSLYVWLRLPA